jgi:D-alanyl-lipoteichoic acid acyltransferase DltB (MBOAT superfamily)
VVIYCDFSGYSDVAIGIAKWMGFTIPANFKSPYQSKNITEFWRRWHISLSSWLRDYLYIPLGGNKNGSLATWLISSLFFVGVYIASANLFHLSPVISVCIAAGILFIFALPALMTRDKKGITTNLNLLTTMLLGGFWHGASWNFILWGALHGTSLAIHKIWILLTRKISGKITNSSLYNAIAILITFHFVCFCWIFFKASSMNDAFAMLHQITHDFGLNVMNGFFNHYKSVLGMIAFAFMLHAIPDSFADKFIGRFKKIPMPVYIALFFVFVIVYGFFKSSEPVMPIYLRF